MFFKRANAKALLQDAISESPITILAMEAGSGKSRLIDSLFEIDGDFDARHCVFVRLDERVADFDTLARCFSKALGHHLPDDANAYEFLLDTIRKLPEHIIIVVDDIHILEGQADALQFVSMLVGESGVYDDVPKRRWLLASRNVEDFPHTIWRADGKCRVLADFAAFDLPLSDTSIFEDTLKLQTGTISKKTPLDITLGYAALRLRKLYPNSLAPKSRAASKLHTKDRYLNLTHQFQSILAPEIADAILVASLPYEINTDVLVDLVPNVNEALQILEDVDLAFVDLSTGHARLDKTFRKALHELLSEAQISTIFQATDVACQLRSENADLTIGFDALLKNEAWNEVVELLSLHGIDLLDRFSSHALVATIINRLPDNVARDCPIVEGLKGLLDASRDVSDKAESWILCALQNDSLQEPLRRNLLYRYCAELARRGRPDASENLAKLLKYVYSENVLDYKIQALCHSLVAAIESSTAPETSLSNIERALRIISIVNDDYAQARVRYDCAFAFKRLGEFEKATSLFTESVKISVPNGFFAMASRAMANLQEIAYEFAHNTPLAIHYLRCMSNYAKKANDVRAEVQAWLGIYWLLIDSGMQADVEDTYDNIVRYSLPDDFMQEQVQLTLVPGAAALQAASGNFAEAIRLAEPYADLASDRGSRAFSWAELCLWYSAIHAKQKDRASKQNYLKALKHVRTLLAETGEKLLLDSDIRARVVISLILMGHSKLILSDLHTFSNAIAEDSRAEAILGITRELLSWNRGNLSIRSFMNALDKLYAANMGGLARVIYFLPSHSELENVLAQSETIK